jgi:hypothetical protein
MKTVCHFLPRRPKPLPPALIRVLMREAAEGKQIVLVRS